MARSGRLAGSIAIVTAGGQGIGEAIARTFAREGATVAVADLNRTEAERVANGIKATGSDAFALEFDATRTDAVNNMVKTVLERCGTVDILVNAAGGFHRLAPITDITDEEWDHVLTVNLKSTFLCSRAVAATMIERKKGRIINIASGSGIAPNPYAPTYLPYGAAKAGVINLTQSLAVEWAPKVRVNCVSGGLIGTEQAELHYGDAAAQARVAATIPAGRLGSPADIAAACVFLASPAAAYISGANLVVHGGGERPAFLDAAT